VVSIFLPLVSDSFRGSQHPLCFPSLPFPGGVLILLLSILAPPLLQSFSLHSHTGRSRDRCGQSHRRWSGCRQAALMRPSRWPLTPGLALRLFLPRSHTDGLSCLVRSIFARHRLHGRAQLFQESLEKEPVTLALPDILIANPPLCVCEPLQTAYIFPRCLSVHP